MQNFEYANPGTVAEATGLLGATWSDAAILAGGTDLLSLMKDYRMSPKRVVNIKSIKGLDKVAKAGGMLSVGAAVTIDDLMEHPAVRSEYPSLMQAAHGITSPQIRNMGTLGGDLCQRPRCWYFRNGYGLLGMQNGKSLIDAGENRYHAIFPQGAAKFVSASSFAPALIALGAKLKIAGKSGNREADLASFFVAPKSEAEREIALQPGEIVTEILIPSAGGSKNATYEVRHKDALDWPLATASVVVKMNGSSVASAKIVMGHVGPTPVSADKAAAWLAGKSITAEAAEAAGKAAVEGAMPLSQNAYKVQLAKVAVKRALMMAAGLSV
ncbi:MAG: FAD binding domain-containing protein [Bryobacteraceae bacterium]|nr:FAD binding domain-containing protein [Bryobacteraceae bacterium]